MSEIAIKLEGVVNISKVEALHHQLEEHYQSGADTIVLDAGEASRIDTSVAQLLLSLVQSTGDTGAKIEWKSVSEDFRGCLALLGMESLVLNGH